MEMHSEMKTYRKWIIPNLQRTIFFFGGGGWRGVKEVPKIKVAQNILILVLEFFKFHEVFETILTHAQTDAILTG